MIQDDTTPEIFHYDDPTPQPIDRSISAQLRRANAESLDLARQQQDSELQSHIRTEARADYEAGYITLNELRAVLGYRPTKGGSHLKSTA